VRGRKEQQDVERQKIGVSATCLIMGCLHDPANV